jgi:hypothetical protein
MLIDHLFVGGALRALDELLRFAEVIHQNPPMAIALIWVGVGVAGPAVMTLRVRNRAVEIRWTSGGNKP